MKQLIKSLMSATVGSLLLASVCLPSFAPGRMVCAAYAALQGPEVTEIVVPYHVVKEGDSLGAICWRLKDEYGDRRDWREIADSIVRDNNKKSSYVYIGERLNVRLQVPAKK